MARLVAVGHVHHRAAASLCVGRTQISRMAAGGTVEQVRRGTYRYAVGEETSHPYAKAAWLACYPKLTAAERLRERPHDAVLACNTAASLHGIGGLHEDPYTFIVRFRRQTSASDLSFHLWDLDERDVTYVEGLPVTTMERTIADLVRERHDPDHVASAARAAYLKGANVARINELLGELGPAYDKEIAIIGTSDGNPMPDEDVAKGIVADVMAMLEMRAQGAEPERRELAPMEQALVEVVRRRIRPILEERATKIEERRLRGRPPQKTQDEFASPQAVGTATGKDNHERMVIEVQNCTRTRAGGEGSRKRNGSKLGTIQARPNPVTGVSAGFFSSHFSFPLATRGFS